MCLFVRYFMNCKMLTSQADAYLNMDVPLEAIEPLVRQMFGMLRTFCASIAPYLPNRLANHMPFDTILHESRDAYMPQANTHLEVDVSLEAVELLFVCSHTSLTLHK